jgi:TNF receptor-associated factor 4
MKRIAELLLKEDKRLQSREGMANELIGGYSLSFIESPPDEFVCLICHLVARDPQQLLCCGKLCCSSCLQESKKHTNKCPQCRKRLRSFQDIRGK